MAAHRYLSSDLGVGASALVAGRVAFGDGAGLVGDSTLAWDNTNKRLGVGRAPDANATLTLHVAAATDARIHFTNTTSGSGGTDGCYIGQNGTEAIFINYEGQLSLYSNGNPALICDISQRTVALGGLVGAQLSGGSLTLGSTSHATKGKIYFGAALTSAFDEVNDRLGIGISSPTVDFHIQKTTSAAGYVQQNFTNLTANGFGLHNFFSGGTEIGGMQMMGTGVSGAGALVANTFRVYAKAGTSGQLALNAEGSSGKVSVYVGGTAAANEYLRVDANGGLLMTAGALATNATAGFFYVRGGSGAPTANPGNPTGAYAMYYDATNNRIYVYNGSWRMVAVA